MMYITIVMRDENKTEDKTMKATVKKLKYNMPESKEHVCPICGFKNNFRFGNVCIHVDRVTAKSKIIYLMPIIERIYNSEYSQNINMR